MLLNSSCTDSEKNTLLTETYSTANFCFVPVSLTQTLQSQCSRYKWSFKTQQKILVHKAGAALRFQKWKFIHLW